MCLGVGGPKAEGPWPRWWLGALPWPPCAVLPLAPYPPRVPAQLLCYTETSSSPRFRRASCSSVSLGS